LNEMQWAALQFADTMARDARVSGTVFHEIRGWLNERQMAEITATVTALNCAARFFWGTQCWRIRPRIVQLCTENITIMYEGFNCLTVLKV
jgi:hypothetical protein